MTPFAPVASPDHAPPMTPADWRARVVVIWLGLVLPLVVVAVAAFSLTRSRTIADLFLFEQDFPVLLLAALFLLVLRFAPLSRLGGGWGQRLLSVRAWPVAAAAAVLAAMAAVAGWAVVFHGYPLSMDEFMAGFDADIFRRGAMVAPLSAEWRPFAFPLQPQFLVPAPGDAWWVSAYLPINAAARAAFAALGAPLLVNAAWTLLALGAVFAVARRLWPQRPDAAAVATVLLATSAQFLLTSMTPYAMPAHLALNMAWLWLFLRGDRRGDAGALAVGLLACGLHQLVFHPLFAAPFIAGLWLGRRWRRAALYTAGYAVVGLVWLAYWKLALPAPPVAAGAHGRLGLLAEVLVLAGKVDPSAIGFMAKNLLRFVAWQNPLMIALALGAAGAAVRGHPTLRALIAGAGLTLVVAALLMPFQGHGWGYRYLHGFLGGFALVAAYGWMRLTDGLATADRRGAAVGFILAALVSLVCLLPIRAVQASRMTAPYAAAAHVIDHTEADVVLVDPTGLFYAADLVRNDPWLQRRPKRMDLGVMTDAQVISVCRRYRVAVFDRRQGLAAGLESNPGAPDERMTALRALLARLRCAG